MESQEILSLIEELVRTESPSYDVEGLAQVSGIVQDQLAGAHVQYRRLDTEAGPLIHAELGGGARRVLLLAHMDTVWERGTLASLPYRVEEGRAYGPGIFDMKAGLAFTVMALRQLAAEPSRAWTIEALFTPDEEVGSHQSRALIEERAKGADLVLVLESPMAAGGLKIGRKGVGSFRLHVSGRAAHAGLEPEKGIDAVEELAHQILAIKGLQRLDLGTTINVGVVRGGTRSNVVAQEALGEIDVRVAEPDEPARLTQAWQNRTAFLPGAEVTVTGEWNRPPMVPTAQAHAWVGVMRELWAGYGRGQLEAGFVGGASDGNFTAPWAPTVDGLGALGDGAHARHEHIELESLGDRLRLLTDVLKQGPIA